MNKEALKEKFKFDLIGRWISCEGTFSNVMSEIWEFYADGNVRIISNSVMSGQETEEFRWRKKGQFCIETTYSEINEPEIWIERYYDFLEITTDTGLMIALIELDGNTKMPQKGFGLMEVPLAYSGETD